MLSRISFNQISQPPLFLQLLVQQQTSIELKLDWLQFQVEAVHIHRRKMR